MHAVSLRPLWSTHREISSGKNTWNNRFSKGKKEVLQHGSWKTCFFQSSLHFTFTALRYIELDNGLQALLISDYSGPAASEDEDGEEEAQDDESGDEMEEESEEEDDDNETGSDYDDDDEGRKKKGNAEKQVLIFFKLVPSLLLSRLVKNVSEEGRTLESR